MILCCVCGKKLSRKHIRYVRETIQEDQGGRIKIETRTRPVCEEHEKQINQGQVPVLDEGHMRRQAAIDDHADGRSE
jgi:hypothetical protein